MERRRWLAWLLCTLTIQMTEFSSKGRPGSFSSPFSAIQNKSFEGLMKVGFLMTSAVFLELNLAHKPPHISSIVGEASRVEGNPNIAKAEQVRQKRAPSNPFLGVGMFDIGMLGALYALVQKEKALNSTIESMTIKLNEKEATVAERMKEIRTVKEERDNLSNQLASANRALTGLQQDFQSEKTLAQSLREDIDHLKGVIAKEGEDKKALIRQKKVAVEAESNRLREELTSEISRIQAESEEVQKSLNQNLDEVKLSLKQRSDKLVSVEEALMKTKQELLLMTDKLKDVMEAREDLKKELLEVNKKAETTANDLKEDKRLVASLNKEVAELRKHTSEDKDARSKLERDLQEAAKSLEEMNRKALTLSRELEMANSKCANLESEKDMLATSLAEEKNFAKEVEKNLEVAHKSLTGAFMEKNEEIRKTKEELDSLSNQLDSANSALTKLQQELQSEKQLTQDLRAQKDHLQGVIAQAGEDKKALGAEVGRKQDAIDILQQRINQLNLEIKDKDISIKNLNLSLAGKESECKNLTSIYKQTREDLAQANSTVEGLKEEVHKLGKELELKKSSEEDLNTRLKLLVTERDEINKKVHDLHEEYDDLKSASAKKAASDAELLSNKDHELNQFKEKMEVALNEASSNQSRNQSLIAELTRERESLRTMLDEEANTVKKLSGELQITQETLGASKLEAADLLKQLNQSKSSCEELKSEVSRIQAESGEVQKSLNQNLDEMMLSLKLRSDELVSVKEALMKTKEELLVMTDELKNVIKARENLTAHDLKEEREVVVSLKKKLEEVSKQILEDKNSCRKLERDLEDATKSLDEMNSKALTLSRELEIAKSKSASLEAEKYLLSKSLAEEKNAAKEVQMNLKEIHKFFTKLCEEVEKLEERSKRLEEELVSTTEAALRLRRECNLNRSTVNEQHQQNGREAQDGAPVVMKRIGRRRRRGPTSEASQRDYVQV